MGVEAGGRKWLLKVAPLLSAKEDTGQKNKMKVSAKKCSGYLSTLSGKPLLNCNSSFVYASNTTLVSFSSLLEYITPFLLSKSSPLNSLT